MLTEAVLTMRAPNPAHPASRPLAIEARAQVAPELLADSEVNLKDML